MRDDGPFDVDDDIRRARTPPASLYTDPALFALQRERVFARGWHWLDEDAASMADGEARPVTLLPGLLDEPLVLTRDAGATRLLSNVCTHRANLVVQAPCRGPTLRCNYHGRRFGLDGRFRAMPEFEGVEGFPSADDDLPRAGLRRLGPLWFGALPGASDFDAWVAGVVARVGWLPLDRLARDPAGDRDYEVRAHWALYCENYLEGFHVPFVHRALAEAIEYESYATEPFATGVWQVALAAREGDAAFEAPPGTPDHGARVAALYAWLFPNTMLNLYPWGLSLNVVRPLAVDRTRVLFRRYAWPGAPDGAGAGDDLHGVEMEDEAVVESVQRGVGARLHRRGRYSPSREAGVHHFHRLLRRALWPG